MNTDWAWMRLLVPEGIVVVTALAALTCDLIITRRRLAWNRGQAAGLLSCLGCVAAIWWLAWRPGPGNPAMLALTPLTQFLKCLLLVLVGFTAIISMRAKFTRHVGEYFALLLLATVGMMLLISSNNLLMIFLALELLSLPLYILTAFNKSSIASAEGALKYFLFGSVAAAFTLFGISLVYGLTGEIDLDSIATHLRAQPAKPAFYAALIMILAGLSFKLAAAPFHFWAPDAYEGAPAPVAAFIASASKVAALFVLAKVLLIGFINQAGSAASGAYAPGWAPLLATLAVVSIGLGNLAALVQNNFKRLLAYSAIAHAGYGLLALLANPEQGLPALLFYIGAYGCAVLGAFAVVTVLEESGSRARLVDLAGLSRRSPLLAFCLLVFVLSLAGIPPLPGFFGKFYVFTATAGGLRPLGGLWLVVVAIIGSVVSLYYYLQALKQVYAAPPLPDCGQLAWSWSARLAISALCAIVIALGCAPNLLLSKICAAIQTSTL